MHDRINLMNLVNIMLPQTHNLASPSLYVIKDTPVIQLASSQQPLPLKRISVRKNGETHHLRPEEILRCVSESNYSYIYYGSGQKVMVAKTLKSIGMSLMASGFVRVHRSHLVRREDILAVFSNCLTLLNGEVIPVSRGFLKTKFKRLSNAN